jgi:hypothetical protein
MGCCFGISVESPLAARFGKENCQLNLGSGAQPRGTLEVWSILEPTSADRRAFRQIVRHPRELCRRHRNADRYGHFVIEKSPAEVPGRGLTMPRLCWRWSSDTRPAT